MADKVNIASLQARVRELEALVEKQAGELAEAQARASIMKEKLGKKSFELNQRITELKAVLQISKLSDIASLTVSEFCDHVLNVVVNSMQYPDIACAEIRLGTEIIRTPNYRQTSWKIGRGLMDRNDMIGYLTVCYLEERSDADFGLFTKEEKNMLVVTTRFLGQIIKRKRIEEQSHISRMVIAQSPSATAITDHEGNIQYCNSAFEEMLGYKLSEIAGKNSDFSEKSPENQAALLEMQRNVSSGKSWTGNVKALTKDGRPIWVRQVLFPILVEGRITNFVSITTNITEQFMLEEEITRQQHSQSLQHQISSISNITASLTDSLVMIFHYLMQFIWIDAGGIYIFDEETEGSLRLVYQEGLSDQFMEDTREFTRDSPNVKLVLAGEPLYLTRADFQDYGGDRLIREGFCFISVIPLVYQEEVVGCMNLASRNFSDITEQDKLIIESIASKIANMLVLIRTQDKLVHSNTELQEMLKKMSENQQLLIQKSKLESLGELAAGLAHEINQPLSVISLVMENIDFKLKDDQLDKEYFIRKIGTIDQNINKIRGLIDHVRIFSRDQGSILFENIDVNHVILNALSLVDAQLQYHRIKVRLALDENLGYTVGNPSRLEQVMFNLISNARDALDENENLSLLELSEKEIYIQTKSKNNKIEIKVRDNGIGIPPAKLDHIFNPFFTTKAEGKGTGLGLSIVYGILSEMNGQIKATSELNKYTEVTITLPGFKPKKNMM